jgi:anti-anti-sigma factor
MAEPHAAPVQVSMDQGVLVLTITVRQIEGEEVAEALRQAMLAAVASQQTPKVVIDFQHIRYVSSVVFRPLLGLRRQLQQIKGRLLVCGLSKTVGDVFYTTRMISNSGNFNAPFEMETDRAAAVARLNATDAAASDE